MKEVVIYSSKNCTFCVKAKRLLNKMGMPYKEILVDEDIEAREKMIALSNRRTVPQIFIDEKHIGGFDDLVSYFGN